VDGYTADLRREVAAWQTAYAQSDLFSVDMGAQLLIWDLRPDRSQPLTVLTGLRKWLYQQCDSAAGVNALAPKALRSGAVQSSAGEIEEALSELLERGLMMKEAELFLSLAIPLGEYSPGAVVLERFHETIKQLGSRSGDNLVIPLPTE
jgi:hypothetical protein